MCHRRRIYFFEQLKNGTSARKIQFHVWKTRMNQRSNDFSSGKTRRYSTIRNNNDFLPSSLVAQAISSLRICCNQRASHVEKPGALNQPGTQGHENVDKRRICKKTHNGACNSASLLRFPLSPCCPLPFCTVCLGCNPGDESFICSCCFRDRKIHCTRKPPFSRSSDTPTQFSFHREAPNFRQQSHFHPSQFVIKQTNY